VARLKEAAQRGRAVELSRTEAERLDRRLAFFTEANVLLASSLDYEVTLRDLARLIVPTLADWCAIHVASEQGVLQFTAGAHRDPSKDLLVRALCEYNPRQPPFGVAYRDADLGQVTDDLLRISAEDAEQLKRLGPSRWQSVPNQGGATPEKTSRLPGSWRPAPPSRWTIRGFTGQPRRRTSATECFSEVIRSQCGSSTRRHFPFWR
jgi:hypothetical protein